MKVIWQSEIDSYASAVLRKHWPHVPNHGDIRTITAASVERPDVLCGGFPCQDISNAGKRAGIDGERSGLWSEYARVIGELRPRYVIVENVSALLGRGLERVLGDLAALGFDAEWHCIPASAVGAPHRRDRLWIVANANDAGLAEFGIGGLRQQERAQRRMDIDRRDCRPPRAVPAADEATDVAYANKPRLERRLRESLRERAGERAVGTSRAYVADAGCEQARAGETTGLNYTPEWGEATADAGERACKCRRPWRVEPNVGRVANGVPSRVDRLRCLGNAIVPQIAEIIGRAILASESAGR